ncbi:MAG: TSUP family transporter [Verrucomicrobiota bacterium]|jgi:uncharacterized membrane protein YfcA
MAITELGNGAGLVLAAGVAGVVDAVAGGGGLIQLPALFLFLPPADAAVVAAVLGTNKLSSICGTGLAAAHYGRRVPLEWSWLAPAAVTAFGFSFLGALSVMFLRPTLLRPVVLGLLVAVALYTFLRRDVGERHAPRMTAGQERWWSVVVGAGIGFYDGFFGPGTGSFLIFIFVGAFGFDFIAASASAKVINLATNLAAVVCFAANGQIFYRFALPMAAANALGGLAGARLAILKGNRFVRSFFLVVAVALIVRFGWDVWRR